MKDSLQVNIMEFPAEPIEENQLDEDYEDDVHQFLRQTSINCEIKPKDFKVSLNTDAEQTLASMERIESLLVERGAELWIQHAPESGALAPARVD